MSKTKKIIALTGNPNTGKTTLFNALTGSNQKIGNWPGVTIEKKTGVFSLGDQTVEAVDLPGTYALSAYSEDERVACDYLMSDEADLIINIIDASNLQRNLFLTVHLIEMKKPQLLIVNMLDLALKKDIFIDTAKLAKELGIPVIAICAHRKEGIDDARKAIEKALQTPCVSERTLHYPDVVEAAIDRWVPKLRGVSETLDAAPLWVAVKLLEKDPRLMEKVFKPEAGNLNKDELDNDIAEIEKTLGVSPDIILAEYKYEFIHNTTSGAINKREQGASVTEKIDRIVMNRFLGIPLFIGVMYLVFWCTMNVGGAFIDFFDQFFGVIFVDGFAELLTRLRTPQWLIAILAAGTGAGIQTVSTFIPIIFMLFFVLSLLEDSGYMARAAFVMDRFMRSIGLPGKAFLPMLLGFGCTIPAVMATRTLENEKDKFLTIFMSPLMSCGARLPVYALFAAAFFPHHSGPIVFSIYLTGIVIAVGTGLFLRKTLFKGDTSHFVMELPPYHFPRMKHIIRLSLSLLSGFVIRAGQIIIIVVTILGFLNSFGIDGSMGNEDSDNSVLASVGKWLTPVFTPMGVEKENWPATVAILTGLFAKEAVVGTLSGLYSQMAVEEESSFDFFGGLTGAFHSIPENLGSVFTGIADSLGFNDVDGAAFAEEPETDESIYGTMRQFFSGGPLQAYAYLLFILIYFPCVAALGVIIKEVGKGWGWIVVLYLTVLGWIISTLFYQIALGHQTLWIIVALALLGLIYVFFRFAAKRWKKLSDGKETAGF